MGTTTTTFALNKPTVGGDDNAWGADWNTNADKLDDLLDGTTAIKPNLSEGLWKVGGVAVTASAAELNILDGVTASTTEINILDGVTASTAELNILDGVTASTAELNFVDGVTSAIQTQLDGKQASLGFTPVQQGGPTGTGTAKIYLGWRTDASGVIAQVDSGTYLGRMVTTTQLTAGSAASTQIDAPGNPPLYACRAWVNFNGTGTVAIRASGNVSSITDNGTGNYTVNFTTAMPDANYATNATSSTNQIAQQTLSASAVQIFTQNSSGVAVDPVEVSITIFR